MSRRAITGDVAPLSAYSPAVKVDAGSMVFVSGQVALGSDGTVVGEGDAEAQARVCFESVARLLVAAGGSLADVVKTTVYLREMNDLPAVRAARDSQPWAVPPATTAVAVEALVDERLLVEIDAVAVIGGA